MKKKVFLVFFVLIILLGSLALVGCNKEESPIVKAPIYTLDNYEDISVVFGRDNIYPIKGEFSDYILIEGCSNPIYGIEYNEHVRKIKIVTRINKIDTEIRLRKLSNLESWQIPENTEMIKINNLDVYKHYNQPFRYVSYEFLFNNVVYKMENMSVKLNSNLNTAGGITLITEAEIMDYAVSCEDYIKSFILY